MWAGFTALINQQAAANGRPSVGFINPAVYAIGESSAYDLDFHDITTGNNTNDTSPAEFFAVPGYDLCTGWGSPTGINLINALATPPDSLNIAPATNLLASGPVGGPFGPTSQYFTLTNIGANPLTWAPGSNASWLNLSLGGGTLSPGGSAANVHVTLGSATAGFSQGAYTAMIWFTNLSDGNVQTRQFVLNVVAAPVISQQPAGQSVPLGGTANFTVGIANNPTVTYRWQQNGTNLIDGGNISGSMTSSLVITNVNSTNVGNYTVVVGNAAKAITSQPASLSITSSAPVIVSQPVSQAAPQGGTAVFTVTAAGNAPLSFQWQWNHTNLTDGGNVLGSASNILTLSNLSPANAGTYSVIVSNSLGSAASSNATLSLISLTASNVTLTTLYSFTGDTDGANPNGLIQYTNGIFYGTTQDGGINESGTVFQMTEAGTVTTLDMFDAATNGDTGASNPSAALTPGPDGDLYSVTENGGAAGWGTIFKITPGGALTDLVDFNDTDGAEPFRALTLGADGGLYGTTVGGGPTENGVVYRVTTNGSLTTLVDFSGPNGLNPNELIQAVNGLFYGTTFSGGANGNGTVFQVTSNGGLTTLVSFNYTNGGFLPFAGLTATPDGNFLGTTFAGGQWGFGTIFEMSPAGAVTTLYSFTGGNDGANPSAGLVAGGDGNYYGTAVNGGAYGDGAVFRITPAGALTSLLQFDGYDGANPQAPLTLGSDGNLYGAAQNGGAYGQGTIFRVNINSPVLQITAQPAAQNAFLGANAIFDIAVVGNAPLYFQWKENGTNLNDGPGVSGSQTRVLTVLNVAPSSSGVYSVLVTNSTSSVLSAGAALGVISSPPQITVQPASQTGLVGASAAFTVTAAGNLPLSYQWQENGTNLTDGGQISGSATSVLTLNNLLEANSVIYSVIVSNAMGSLSSDGATLTVYAVSAGGTTMQALYAFTGGSDGGDPNALVQGANGLLYGTTQTGGSFGDGTIFSISTNGVLTTMLEFNGTNGATPVAGLIEDTNGLFYGTTKLGGANSGGTLFSIAPDGTFNSIYSFSATNDSIDPLTALFQDASGNIYGATSNNAVAGEGNIFKMAPGGVPSAFCTFASGLNGTLPVGALALGNDGNFYGMTGTGIGGGTSTNGNIFRITPQGAITNIYSFTGVSDGYLPIGQLALGTDGNFYGVTRRNKIANTPAYGTVFKVTPAGALTTIYTLNGVLDRTDGAYPFAGLLQAADGNFYGTTLQGFYLTLNGVIYNSSYGTVFRVTPGGGYATLTDFNDSDDGAYPATTLVQGADGGLYGTTSQGGPGGHGTVFRLGYASAPQILTQPASQTNAIGGTASFDVTVTGAPLLTYQWQENGTNLSDGGGVSGTATRVLTLRNLAAGQTGTYSVIVNNALGSATSSGANLTVASQPIFQSATLTGNSLVLAWSTAPGLAYQLQSTTNLSAGWTNLRSAVPATNIIMTSSDIIGATGQKYYRIIVAP
jgi:uncharacterized repeat protein (TIGR03803 family)